MIKLLAFDLDGTLLDDEKHVSPRAVRALSDAADAGVVIVPATGRLPGGLPSDITALPFIRYAIMLNGALAGDIRSGSRLYECAFSRSEGLEVWDMISSVDAMKDVFINDGGFMEESLRPRVSAYCLSAPVMRLVLDTRTFVPEVRPLLEAADERTGAQKFNLYFPAEHYRESMPEARRELERVPYLQLARSVPNNLEINRRGADKGRALIELCRILGISPEETAAFGDGENDISLLRSAGLGIAMANADPEIKAAADEVTDHDNDHDGFAIAVERLMTGRT